MSDDKNDAIDSTAESTSAQAGDIKTKILNPQHWIRALIMLLMYIVLSVAVRFIVCVAAIIQWVLTLLSGEPNEKLRDFTASLNQYGYQIMQFMTFNDDTRPFPFSDWPSGK